ncbi:TetR/AcrR family transcriptional regulator [Gudongella sp. DL1XJH-153]|uniref:TetR/AcrR family transcriptional regulator n=1 Tax=Gudongella sp. DL1XJH-153 TaxID=3409804 RepID=UPI003BB5368A
MENFLSLPEDKQKSIRDAALKVFGENGYKKASVKDIADEAGISKSMVFHYFGTKKSLYLYLVDYCSKVLTGPLTSIQKDLPRDYFERMKVATEKQMGVLRDEPFFLKFLNSMLSESDHEISEELQTYRDYAASFQSSYALDDIDFSKFKDDVDLKVVLRMMIWMAEGFSRNVALDSEEALDKYIGQFNEAVEMLRNNLYKEEYL